MNLCSPMGRGLGAGRVGGKELRLSEAGWDGSVLNAAELLYRKTLCR